MSWAQHGRNPVVGRSQLCTLLLYTALGILTLLSIKTLLNLTLQGASLILWCWAPLGQGVNVEVQTFCATLNLLNTLVQRSQQKPQRCLFCKNLTFFIEKLVSLNWMLDFHLVELELEHRTSIPKEQKTSITCLVDRWFHNAFITTVDAGQRGSPFKDPNMTGDWYWMQHFCFLVKMILISTMISTAVTILISTIKLNLGGKKLTNNSGFKIHSLLSNVLKDFNVHSHETINLLCVEINHKAVIFIMG